MSAGPEFRVGGRISVSTGPKLFVSNKLSVGKLIINGFADIQVTETGSIEAASIQGDDLQLEGDSRLSTRVKKEVAGMGGHLQRNPSTSRLKLTGGEQGIILKSEDLKKLNELKKDSERDQQILAFFKAVKENKKTEVEKMLSSDKSLVNSIYEGWSPLHFACVAKPVAFEIATLLIEHGADINYECGDTRKKPLQRIKNKTKRKKLRDLAEQLQKSKVTETSKDVKNEAYPAATADRGDSKGHAEKAAATADRGDSKGHAEKTAATSDRGDSKGHAEKTAATDAQAEEAKMLSEITQVLDRLDGMKCQWASSDIKLSVLTTTSGRREVSGTLYEITATKGLLAITSINAGNDAAGRLFVGVRFPDSKRILLIATFEKQEGHDFYINLDNVCAEPPKVQIGVFRTPHDYHLNPFLGFNTKERRVLNPEIDLNCNSDDTWHDSLRESFKFRTQAQSLDLLGFAGARLSPLSYEITSAEQILTITDPSNVPGHQLFHGYAYKAWANKGQLAMKATNVGKSGPGKLSLGLRAPNTKQIFLLAEIEKTEGHDFYSELTDHQISPPRASFGVYRVSNPKTYDLKPCLGFIDKTKLKRYVDTAYLACDETDNWHDVLRKTLKRTHSPTGRQPG